MIKTDLRNRIDTLSPKAKKLFLLKLGQSLDSNAAHDLDSGHKKLVAYVKGKAGFDTAVLKSYLRESLPDYMIPSSIITLDEIPTLPNGKVDKKKLFKIKAKTLDGQVKEAVTFSDTETKLVSIWEEVLNFSPVEIEDNFFEIGGDSILSIQVIAKARALGMDLSPNQLFEHQTIAQLAPFAVTSKDEESTNVETDQKLNHVVSIRPNGSKSPLFCLHTGGSHFFFYNLLAKYLNPDRPIYVLQASGLKDEVKLHLTVEEMANDFVDEIKRVQPSGPYHIMSYCFSTAVGLEIAQIFNRKSDIVHFLVVDTSSINQNLYAFSKTGTRALRIIKLILKKPVKTVKRAVNTRLKLYVKPAFLRRFGNEDQKKVAKLSHNNVRIYYNYKWLPFDGSLSLLLTEKPYHPGLNEYILDSWGKIVKKDLNIVHTKGQHTTLFSEPDVRHTANNLEKCMQEFESYSK